jgi:hypothetical protein
MAFPLRPRTLVHAAVVTADDPLGDSMSVHGQQAQAASTTPHDPQAQSPSAVRIWLVDAAG